MDFPNNNNGLLFLFSLDSLYSIILSGIKHRQKLNCVVFCKLGFSFWFDNYTVH